MQVNRAFQADNGTAADELPVTSWRKSRASNPSGSCVEVAELPDGSIAVRNSRHPSGPALIYTRAEVAAFLAGVKGGEFDDLGAQSDSARLVNCVGWHERRQAEAVIWCCAFSVAADGGDTSVVIALEGGAY